MQKPYLLTLLISLCLLQGCVTRYQSQPEVNGQLLDNAGKPIAGAKITLTSSGDSADTLSDSDGRFSFNKAHKWAFYLPIGPIDWMHRAELHFTTPHGEYAYLLTSRMGNAHELDGAQYHVRCKIPAAAMTPPPEICYRVGD
ncbi:TPA: carboxypeptidase regulatory-like domain-containing protein [Klebsiella aerogenes]|nr:carboxypeptidase regulatory-like domain-containing protein [Klebsiella aerogenes]